LAAGIIVAGMLLLATLAFSSFLTWRRIKTTTRWVVVQFECLLSWREFLQAAASGFVGWVLSMQM
jgi:hypothetical protein